MLRYAHYMPPTFTHAFIQGLGKNINFPAHWMEITDILNIVSLLDCFIRSDLELCPNQHADIKNLIHHFTDR